MIDDIERRYGATETYPLTLVLHRVVRRQNPSPDSAHRFDQSVCNIASSDSSVSTDGRRRPTHGRRLSSLTAVRDPRETAFRGRCSKSRAMRIRTSGNYECRSGLYDDVGTLLNENTRSGIIDGPSPLRPSPVLFGFALPASARLPLTVASGASTPERFPSD